MGRIQGYRLRRVSDYCSQLGRAETVHVGLRRDCAHRQAIDARHRRIELLKQEIQDYYATYRVTNDLIELRNLLHVADLIVGVR